ncbi:MAG: hypothetical protein M3076_09695 [Actinomycetota bacterium]|nr:hypothetical protein [Actinomycetota bacterium]
MDQPIERTQQRRAGKEGCFEHFAVRQPLAPHTVDRHLNRSAIALQGALSGCPRGRTAVECQADRPGTSDPGTPELPLGQASRDFARTEAWLVGRKNPLGQVPDPLAALTANRGNPTTEPQQFKHPSEVLAVVPAAAAPWDAGAVLKLA